MEHQSEKDKYCIAWFKLSECLARKEKERALGVYRLLYHSIDDEALAVQLEGDLLLFFDDEVAIAKYKRAVELYEKQERFPLAIGVCEHIITLKPSDLWALKRLSDLYRITGITHKLQEIEQKLALIAT